MGSASEKTGKQGDLRDQRAFLLQIIDMNPNLIFIKDREGRFTLVNRAVAELYGTTVDEVVGKTDADFNSNTAEVEWFRRDDLEVMDSLQEKAIAQEIITDAHGNQRYLQTIKRPLIDADGVARHLLGVSVDITKLRQSQIAQRNLERQVQHAQKLESLGVLAGGIAHDFNNLLVGVLGNADLALLQLPENSSVRPLLDRVSTAAMRAADLCRQLLAYSGRGRFVIETVNLNDVVQEMTELLHVSISKKAAFTLELSDKLPNIEADPSQIRQVIMNLITNASDALAEQRGAIVLRTGATTCDEEFLRQAHGAEGSQPGTYCFVEVVDNGVGMSEDVQRTMFEPFFSTKFTGRGLGLAAVLGIVNGHHGAIQYESRPGCGTTARVFLPVSGTVAEPVGRQLPVGAAAVEPVQVLIVDDEPAVREVLLAIVKSAKFQAIALPRGGDALTLLRRDPYAFSILLLDLTMPEMSGIEVLREVRRLNRDLPVVLLSGYSKEDALRGCETVGRIGFLQKPFGSRELLREIQRVLTLG